MLHNTGRVVPPPSRERDEAEGAWCFFKTRLWDTTRNLEGTTPNHHPEFSQCSPGQNFPG